MEEETAEELTSKAFSPLKTVMRGLLKKVIKGNIPELQAK